MLVYLILNVHANMHAMTTIVLLQPCRLMDDIEQTTEERRCVPPWVRLLRYHLDSCAGTNKSQFVMGGLGMLVATGRLDFINVLYMVVGHTKFGPDNVARSIAGRFNTSDTFNHAMLNNHISAYASVSAYDGDLLRSWKRSSSQVFNEIRGIMSYRCFFILGDDGRVLLKKTKLPEDFEMYSGRGEYYKAQDIVLEGQRQAFRSLSERVVPSIIDGSYTGVGEGFESHQDDEQGKFILPRSVSKVMQPRLFVMRTEKDKICFEITDWVKDCSLSKINVALRIVSKYSSIGEMGKEAYGQKKKQIAEQYEKYVDPRFVPDCFKVGTERQDVTPSSPDAEAEDGAGSATRPGTVPSKVVANGRKRPRWREREHAKHLINILSEHFGGKLPQSSKGFKELADFMPKNGDEDPWDPSTIRRHARKMEGKGLFRNLHSSALQ